MSHAVPAPHPGLQLQPQRILATSLAVAMHLAAFGLLLMPLARPEPATPATQRTEVRIEPARVVPPPPPPPMPLSAPATPRPAQAAPVAPPLILPVVVDQVDTQALVQAAAELQQRLDLGLAVAAPQLIASADRGLQVVHAPPPPYPGLALARQLEGEVLLRVQIDAEGRVTAVDIERSSGHRMLDQAARMQVLRRWQFAPASTNGRPAAAQGLVPIRFRID